MRVLSLNEYSNVSGGNPGEALAIAGIGIVSLTGGYVLSSVTGYFSSVSTVGSIIGAGGMAGLACTFVMPVVGTVVCGTAGAVGGYFLGSTLVNAAAFILG